MPRSIGKRRKPRYEPSEIYIFEIARWEPTYGLSVDPSRDRAGPYSEHAILEIQATCILPRKLAGRTAQFSLAGQRDFLSPPDYKHDPKWTPRCIGLLELPPSGGRFYALVPHDSLPMLMASLALRMCRYILLFGPPLSRGKSLCTSLQLERSVDLEDY